MASEKLPQTVQDEAQLDELLSRLTPAVVDLFKRLNSEVAIIGGPAGGAKLTD